MFKLSPLELRQSLTDAEFTTPLQISITDLKDLLDDFEKWTFRRLLY
jgi:hypothetical protein